MRTQLVTTLATISDGHADLADVLFLLAFIAAAIAVALVVLAKPINLLWLALSLAAALFALGFFVL